MSQANKVAIVQSLFMMLLFLVAAPYHHHRHRLMELEQLLIKSSNIGALAKLVTLHVGETYPDIEKKLVKIQRKISKKRGLLKRLSVNGRDDDFFNV